LVGIEGGPASGLVGFVLDLGGGVMDLGIEVIDAGEGDGFEGHGELWAAEFERAVVADDHVFESDAEIVWEGFVEEFFDLADFGAEEADALDQMADELAFVSI
jgi:hypothetical protein